jgi:hypothetical protein
MVVRMVSNEEISRKLTEKKNPNRKSLTEDGTVSSEELKKKFKAKRDKQNENPGYLICDTCMGYYQLQPGESPDDFVEECECGGNLEHVKTIKGVKSLEKI